MQVIEHLGIVGECNIQFALNPQNNDYRVIEVNARLSRSSALASKATGYPLAYIAAKIGLGYNLPELKNSVTLSTSAFFEPALDYIVIKIPRWDLQKFVGAKESIGSEMKSVGEVMGIGRSFPECLQKAVGMLNVGASCLSDYPQEITDPKHEIQFPTDRRIFALYQYFRDGGTVEEAHALSKINEWFLHHIHATAQTENRLRQEKLDNPLLRTAKRMGSFAVGRGCFVNMFCNGC